MVNQLDAESADWPVEARDRLTLLKKIAGGPDSAPAALQTVFLRNVLARVPAYRQSLDAVRTPAIFVGEPFVKFLKLPAIDRKKTCSIRYVDRLYIGRCR